MKQRVWIFLGILFLLACSNGSHNGQYTTKDQGTEGGPCFPNGTCMGTLACFSDICVNPNPCTPLDALLSDSSGSAMQAAIKEHTPTQQELMRAALIWSIAVELYQGQITDERLVSPEFKQLLADVQNEYPSTMAGCSGSGKTSQALITTKDDFACNNSCVPSADLFKTSIGKIADKIMGGLLGTAMSKKSKEIVEGTITLLEGGKDLKEAADSMNPDDATTVITNVSSAAGTIAGVAGVLKMAGAAEIAAVIGAFQVGWEIGSALNLVIECTQWKAAHCGPDGGMGGIGGSGGSGGSSGSMKMLCTWTPPAPGIGGRCDCQLLNSEFSKGCTNQPGQTCSDQTRACDCICPKTGDITGTEKWCCFNGNIDCSCLTTYSGNACEPETSGEAPVPQCPPS